MIDELTSTSELNWENDWKKNFDWTKTRKELKENPS